MWQCSKSSWEVESFCFLVRLLNDFDLIRVQILGKKTSFYESVQPKNSVAAVDSQTITTTTTTALTKSSGKNEGRRSSDEDFEWCTCAET